jgi:hypothetical protein
MSAVRRSLPKWQAAETDVGDISPGSFNHLVRAVEQRRRHVEAKRLGGLEIDHQLELARQLDRQVGGLLPLEDAIGIYSRLVGIDRECRRHRTSGRHRQWRNAMHRSSAGDDVDSQLPASKIHNSGRIHRRRVELFDFSSSARARSVGGSSRPSAFAVFSRN